ncbi:glycosyltransferase [bacterium]|nr:glycosyltransferase [candidate division CSSED10-310 bacterium]
MSAAVAPLIYYHWVPRRAAIIASGITLFLALLIDLARLTLPAVNAWFYKRLHMLIREDERKSLNTSTWFCMAIFITVLLYEKNVAVVALLFLSFGDPVAAIIGSTYGTRKVLNKSLQGSAACFIVCFVLAQMLFPLHIALWAALCATIFELLSSKINDNLAIPLFSGLAITLLLKEPVISTPLRFAFVVFQVYLLFVIATFIFGIVFRHVTIALYHRFYKRGYPVTHYAPPVSILKPVRGVEDGCFENFKAFCELEYEGGYELIFAMEDANDPAREVIERLRREYPEQVIKVTDHGSDCPGGHGKIRNLIAAEKVASGDILVVSDADVRPSPQYLRRLVRPMADPAVAMVTAVPSYHGARNIPAAMEAIITFFLSFSIYYPMAYFERLNTAIGSTMAIRKEALTATGGFVQACDHIADEHVLAERLAERGYKLVLANRPVRIHNRRASWRGWLAEVHRRNVMFRTYKPQVYPFYLFQSGIFHAFLYWLAVPSTLSLALLLLAVGAETLSLATLNFLYVKDRSTYFFLWLIPLLSVIGPLLWLSPFFSSIVAWRDRRYYVAKSGIVTELHG